MTFAPNILHHGSGERGRVSSTHYNTPAAAAALGVVVLVPVLVPVLVMLVGAVGAAAAAVVSATRSNACDIDAGSIWVIQVRDLMRALQWAC